MPASKKVTFKLTESTDSEDQSHRIYSPVTEIKEKWRLLPSYLGMRGIARQHINSYDNFVINEIKNIMNAPSNKVIRTELDPNFFLEFVDIRVGRPSIMHDANPYDLTPQMCRIRDLTYSAPILVDVDYVRGSDYIRKNNVEIGMLPVMLRSSVCALSGKHDSSGHSTSQKSTHNKSFRESLKSKLDRSYFDHFVTMTPEDRNYFYESSKYDECPYDPGGYFIINGVEKVILMQEQLSKSRIIVEMAEKKNIIATITSATAESKSRTAVSYKNCQLYLTHNSFTNDIPLCIVLKALGVETDKEIIQLISETTGKENLMSQDYSKGTTPKPHNTFDFMIFVRDLYSENINTRMDAVLFLGKKIRPKPIFKGFFSSMKERGPKSNQMIIEETHDFLKRVMLSHVPMKNSRDFSGKIKILALMARRVLKVVNKVDIVDDKDHYGNKRLELAGQLISILFEDLYKRFIRQVKKNIDSLLESYIVSKNTTKGEVVQYPDVFRNLPSDILTTGMINAISTGNWNIKRFRMERTGVSQVLSRLSYISSIGMMTRTNSQFEKGRKVSGPRALQPSQFGMVCPCDTPEGESCGLVKNLSLMTHVTSEVPTSNLETFIFAMGVEPLNTISSHDLFSHSRTKRLRDKINENSRLVLLNGVLLGIHPNYKFLVNGIIKMRRKGIISMFVSVHENHQHKQVHISSDGGRLCRPLIVVENNKPKLTSKLMQKLIKNEINIDYLFQQGILEWIDVNEENNLLIMIKEKDINEMTTHLEITPMSILGVVAGLIPFPNHNQSPRNTYQCAMGKQSIGSIGYNQLKRCDTMVHLMDYTHVPLVTTKTIQIINFDKLPAGQNAIVAVMSHQGYEIEDAIILNRASVDRGFSRCYTMRKISCEVTKSQRTEVESYNTSIRQNNKNAPLNKEYIVEVGETVVPGQLLISTKLPKEENTESVRTGEKDVQQEDSYMYFKYNIRTIGHIDRIVLTETANENRLYKIMVYQRRMPEVGDKFSSRHGQKGVVGLILDPEDMPFTESGIIPDLIMNPHGFPSRMTVGNLLELVASKSSVLSGKFVDSTPFSGNYSDNYYKNIVPPKKKKGKRVEKGNKLIENIKEVFEVLISSGFHPRGKEIMYSGITGNLINTLIFVGPIYYQRLKHMVMDKIHARARGPRQILTRQPTEGRSKEGGLRLGEMERDCLIAYGSSNLLVERLMLSSDVFDVKVCDFCGFIGYQNYCKFCQNSALVGVSMPYACKLLIQELQAMNIKPTIAVKNL